MASSDLDRYLHQLYSEHGEDRRQAIGWFCAHPEEGRPVLRSFFQPLEQEWAAEAALEALGCIGDPEDVPLLDSVLIGGKLCFKAGFALAKNNSPTALETLKLRSQDGNEAVARGAIGGLGERGDQSVRSLLESLLHSPMPNVRYATVLALGQLGADASRQALLDCLKTEANQDVRHKIKEILKH